MELRCTCKSQVSFSSVRVSLIYVVSANSPLHSPDRTSSSSSSIPDVPAIYFGLPNDENVERICRDIQSDLYGSFYLNFIRPVPRSKIEDIASAVLSSSDTKCVNKIYDQYVDFVCLEDELFVFSTDSKNAEDFYGEFYPSKKVGSSS